MIAIIFEVIPHPEHKDRYLQIAGNMRTLAEGIDGFISVERFQSLTHPEKLLSLSLWRNEAAVDAWRKLEKHRAAQKAGRDTIFRDYTLRVAHVIRDYGMHEREQAPPDSKAAHGI